MNSVCPLSLSTKTTMQSDTGIPWSQVCEIQVRQPQVCLTPLCVPQSKPIRTSSPLSWHIRPEREEEEERKCFPAFPNSQSSPARSPARGAHPGPGGPPLPANGERRGRGRPPKNWPWGRPKDTPRGRPRKPRPAEEDEEEEDDEEDGADALEPAAPSLSPAALLLGAEKEVAGSAVGRPKEPPRHPAVPAPRSRGRPPRKKRGPKRRLSEGSGDGPPPALPPAPARLSEPLPPPMRRGCFSESSEDEEEDDEELRPRSPPVLTKPTLGLKCKVRAHPTASCTLSIRTLESFTRVARFSTVWLGKAMLCYAVLG